jgi:hypothetical protein
MGEPFLHELVKDRLPYAPASEEELAVPILITVLRVPSKRSPVAVPNKHSVPAVEIW